MLSYINGILQSRMAEYFCDFCHRGFAWKQAKVRHERSQVCIQRIPDADQVIETLERFKLHDIKQYIQHIMDEVKALKATQKQMEQDMEQRVHAIVNKVLASRTKGSPVQNGNTIIHGSGHCNITSNHNNNNNINIVLSNFGKEDTSHITHEDIVKWAKDPANGVLMYIEKKHFDPTKPENHNIKLASMKREEVDVHINGKWQRKDAKPVAYEIIESTLDALQSGLDWSTISDDAEKYFSDVSNDPKCPLGRMTAKEFIFLLHRQRELANAANKQQVTR